MSRPRINGPCQGLAKCGTPCGYIHHGCRGPSCSDAKAQENRRQQSARRLTSRLGNPVGEKRHDDAIDTILEVLGG